MICRTLNETPNACKLVFRILKPDTSRMGHFGAVRQVISVRHLVKRPARPPGRFHVWWTDVFLDHHVFILIWGGIFADAGCVFPSFTKCIIGFFAQL